MLFGRGQSRSNCLEIKKKWAMLFTCADSEIKFHQLTRLRNPVSCVYNLSSTSLLNDHERRLRMPYTSSSRLESLQARHNALENKIRMEQSRPGSDGWFVSSLKRQRLHVKEQIEGIAG